MVSLFTRRVAAHQSAPIARSGMIARCVPHLGDQIGGVPSAPSRGRVSGSKIEQHEAAESAAPSDGRQRQPDDIVRAEQRRQQA